jgi:dynamin 1-like protein
VNGHAPGADEDESGLSEDGIFPPRPDNRSVSSTLHDRERSSRSSLPASSTTPTMRASSHHRHPDQMPSPNTATKQHSQSSTPLSSHRVHSNPNLGHGPTASGSGSSPHSARETFLNYFFGQNGPGPVTGSVATGERVHGHSMSGQQGIVPVGRDVSEMENTTTNNITMSSGLTGPGRIGADGYGNSAAYDMKSLGKHIEAVSSSFYFILCFYWMSMLMLPPSTRCL